MNLANLAELNKVATAMVTPGKGILAADESSGTIKKRFDAIQVESTEESRSRASSGTCLRIALTSRPSGGRPGRFCP